MRIKTENVKPGDKLLLLEMMREVTSVTSRVRHDTKKRAYEFEFNNYPPVTAHPGETFEGQRN